MKSIFLASLVSAALLTGCSSQAPKPYVVPPTTPEQKAAKEKALAELLYQAPANYALIPPDCDDCTPAELERHGEKVKYEAEFLSNPEFFHLEGWTVVDCDAEPGVCESVGRPTDRCDEFPSICAYAR
ncbi:hypothetical protein [Pseudomonas sp. TUM22785]|uniref:hypothetical protein n=1 Tax=Pseudomonas sp. TUM22785 TaxID=3019098 RepID=UPI002306B641|nr:hypothetical protein [Pseudomonas sp. TUM22785]WCD79173.1 hypothetical protein PI990_24740 [Pseudomonas sp. TUM22785]